MAFVYEHQKFALGEVIEQGKGRVAYLSAVKITAVIFNPATIPDFAHHFNIVMGALFQPLCFEQALSVPKGLKLFFQEDTGLLRWADTCGDAQNRNEINTVSGSVEMTQEARLQESRNWAELLLGENRIGDLVQKEEAIERWISFVEYYEGQPTGTSVTVIWDGNVVDSVVTYIGEIFEKDRLGRVVPKNREEKIAQERAIEIGIAYIEDAAANDILDLDTVGCELQIFGGRWTYQISAETEPDAGGFTTTFVAVLDP